MPTVWFIWALAKKGGTENEHSGELDSEGNAIEIAEVEVEVGTVCTDRRKIMVLWLWDFFDVYTFSLVGGDVVAKARPEYVVQLWLGFNFVQIVGLLIPIGHFALTSSTSKQISLRSYVAVESIYDLLQGAIVGFFWEIDAGYLREGEEVRWQFFVLSAVTSFVDGVLMKGPAAFFS